MGAAERCRAPVGRGHHVVADGARAPAAATAGHLRASPGLTPLWLLLATSPRTLVPCHESGWLDMIVFTVCPATIIAYALTLHEALARHHRDLRFYVALADGDEGLDTTTLPFEVLRPSELGLPDLEAMVTNYSEVEFRAAIKPFVFQVIFDRHPGVGVLYLDPDTYVASRFEELFDLVSGGAECVLVPAITEPAEYAEIDDGQFLRFGAYDLGFCWLADRPEVRRVVWWWARRLERDCLIDPAAGLYPDQRWADLFPALIDDAHPASPGLDVAYWNLGQRRLRHLDGRWLVNGVPLRTFCFSGIGVEDATISASHSTSPVGPAADLLREFRAAVIQSMSFLLAGDDYVTGGCNSLISQELTARAHAARGHTPHNNAAETTGQAVHG